jgi:hypothetical protein
MEFKVYDVEGKCYIPKDCVAITSDGKIITYDEINDLWLEDEIKVIVEWRIK